jgi:sulfopyruvate decarboxylase TPP-binding subunit
MGRAIVPILDGFNVPHLTIEHPGAAEEAVRTAATLAFAKRHPAACLLPRRLTVPGGRP